MNNIKMKFWCEERQCMYEWLKHFDSINITKDWIRPVLNDEVKDNYDWYKLNYIPLRYTGMKDKNGKEIYEGDIVGHLNMRAEIIFENGSFEFKWLDKITKRVRRYNEPMFKNTSIVFEVIGNIYENKELLEE